MGGGTLGLQAVSHSTRRLQSNTKTSVLMQGASSHNASNGTICGFGDPLMTHLLEDRFRLPRVVKSSKGGGASSDHPFPKYILIHQISTRDRIFAVISFLSTLYLDFFLRP
jgi:hypothetical protein